MTGDLTVRVEPAGIDFVASVGETVMEAANRSAVDWTTICGGIGVCTACYFRVDDAAAFEPPLEAELERLVHVRRRYPTVSSDQVRLGCRAIFAGTDVTIVKRSIVDPKGL